MRIKPQNVSEKKWRDLLDAVGGENNPRCLWPVQYDGFDGLLRRKQEAAAEMKAQEDYLTGATAAMRQIIQWASTEVDKRMQDIKNKNMEQQHRLIKVFRAVNQAQMKMYADANGGAVPPMSAEEIELLNDFKALSARVNRSAASLPRRAEALAAASRLQHTIAPADEVQLSDQERDRIAQIIERQSAQIDELERKIDAKVKAHQRSIELAEKSHSNGRTPTSPQSSSSLLFTDSMLRRY